MREIRTYGSEGGGVLRHSPYPYRVVSLSVVKISARFFDKLLARADARNPSLAYAAPRYAASWNRSA